MKSVKTLRMLLCVSLTLGLATSAWGQLYDVYKNGVPDVTKQAPDSSCWLACASNVLGGAGWGNANTIYNDMVNQFGVNLGGHPHAAAKWWVHNIGLNSAMAGQGYNPTADYVNFQLIEKTLTAVEYDYLLDELNRCQYVAVSWFWGGRRASGSPRASGTTPTTSARPSPPTWSRTT